jgi:uroporphyrinogen-III synthase
MSMCEARAMPRASRKFPLGGWYVISTRPLNQHGGVRRSAAKAGATTFALSTLELQPLSAQVPLRQALDCPIVVVTSPAAARFANAQVALSSRTGQTWLALGKGSAEALRRCGIERVQLPEGGADSESLLAHSALSRVRGQRIGLITAPGGRGVLADALRASGAKLVVAEVYRRQPRRLSVARLSALDALPIRTGLLITSSEAFGLLWSGLDEASRARLLSRPCIVSSERLATQAAALGFRSVLRAADARPASLLAALVDHVAGSDFR